jgi:hypothetical protein
MLENMNLHYPTEGVILECRAAVSITNVQNFVVPVPCRRSLVDRQLLADLWPDAIPTHVRSLSWPAQCEATAISGY